MGVDVKLVIAVIGLMFPLYVISVGLRLIAGEIWLRIVERRLAREHERSLGETRRLEYLTEFAKVLNDNTLERYIWFFKTYYDEMNDFSKDFIRERMRAILLSK